MPTMKGDAHAAGSIVCVDLSGDIVAVFTLSLTGIPTGIAFQPHGLFFSNDTGLLYAVTHGLAAGGGSRIIVLELNGADAREPREMRLRYRGSVASPLFRNGARNDVAEGFVPGELFVTEWLQVSGCPLPSSQ